MGGGRSRVQQRRAEKLYEEAMKPDRMYRDRPSPFPFRDKQITPSAKVMAVVGVPKGVSRRVLTSKKARQERIDRVKRTGQWNVPKMKPYVPAGV